MMSDESVQDGDVTEEPTEIEEDAIVDDTEDNIATETENDSQATELETDDLSTQNADDVPIAAAEFESFEDHDGRADGSANEDLGLDVILDVPVTVSMEIGRTRINIRNLLQLNQGSVIELNRLAGEPMDVLANGTLIAHGEVVVVNDKFGIRLTDVVSPAERVNKLA